MMLGKRARARPPPPMKRTTSMTEFTIDLNSGVYQHQQPSDPLDGPDHHAPRLNRRNSMDSSTSTAAHFLRVCSLCKRRLTPARDIYMYRGDSAFCSLECRQRKMGEDEKCSSAPNNMEAAASSATAAAKNKVSATGGGTVAAL